MNKDLVTYRPIQTASDEAFVYNAWLKSYKDSPWGKPLINDIFFTNHKEIVKKLLDSSEVLLAVNPEDPDQIYGFAVIEKSPRVSIIHYVYVKYNFRKLGLARDLVETLEPMAYKVKFVTHVPRDIAILKKFNLVFNPYIL